jgi:phage baseplate assembly protein W
MALKSRENDYSDLDLDFIPQETTGDVVIRKGDDAIQRAVRNLILTNFYERPFQSYLGSGVTGLLFENMTPMTENNLKLAIREVIDNYEPRVQLQEVITRFDIDNNGFDVTLYYKILNTNEPIVAGLFLERIR